MITTEFMILKKCLYHRLSTDRNYEIKKHILKENTEKGLIISVLGVLNLISSANLNHAIHSYFSDYLNVDFLHFVFNALENPPTVEHEEQMPDLLVNFILAFNLHFKMPSENLVMRVIEEKKTVKVFSEKILLLFNRDGKTLIIW